MAITPSFSVNCRFYTPERNFYAAALRLESSFHLLIGGGGARFQELRTYAFSNVLASCVYSSIKQADDILLLSHIVNFITLNLYNKRCLP